MSKVVVWAVPNSIVEEAICSNAHLEGPVSVIACGMDEVGEQLLVGVELEYEDLERLYALDDLTLMDYDEAEFKN